MATLIDDRYAYPATETGEVAIEARGVTKDFGDGESQVQILKGVDLVISHGEMLAIMGPSGSGKSTLLGALSGLDTVTNGQITIEGQDITHMGENDLATVRNRHIGFVFQTFNLIGTLSAQENVELPILLSGHGGFAPSKRANEMLDLVGLSHRRKHRPGQMSGGEQQRVAIARALANDPEILFGDEPTGNLDTANGEAVMNLLFLDPAQTGHSNSPSMAVGGNKWSCACLSGTPGLCHGGRSYSRIRGPAAHPLRQYPCHDEQSAASPGVDVRPSL
jgi:putative ABC transport system ATP-binding protein